MQVGMTVTYYLIIPTINWYSKAVGELLEIFSGIFGEYARLKSYSLKISALDKKLSSHLHDGSSSENL